MDEQMISGGQNHARWCGRPVHELSRDELHQAFGSLIEQNERLRREAMERSVAEIHDLAASLGR